MNRLEGRKIIITGGGAGIGAETVRRVLSEGAHVVAFDLNTDGLAQVSDSVSDDERSRLEVRSVDVSNEAAVTSEVASAIEHLGGLNGLVNAAGVMKASHTHEAETDMFDFVVGINLKGTFMMCREAITEMLKNKDGGSIVNFSSTSATFGHPYMAAYSASKGGVEALTHTLAAEYAKRNIRATCVKPGGIESQLTGSVPGLMPDNVDWDLLTKWIPLLGGNLGNPVHVASVVAMLLSDDGGFITGTEIRIDGGAHA